MSGIITYLSENYPLTDFMKELLKESGLNQFSIVQLKNYAYLEKLKQFTIDNYSSFYHLADYWKVTKQCLPSKIAEKKKASIDQFFLPGEVDLLRGIAEEVGQEIKNSREFVKRHFTTKSVEEEKQTVTELMKSLNKAIDGAVQLSESEEDFDYKQDMIFSKSITVKEENLKISATLKCITCENILILPFVDNVWVTTNLLAHINHGHSSKMHHNDFDEQKFKGFDMNVPSSSGIASFKITELESGEDDERQITDVTAVQKLDRLLVKIFSNKISTSKTIKRKLSDRGNGKYAARIKCPLCGTIVSLWYYRTSWIRSNLLRHIDKFCKDRNEGKKKPKLNYLFDSAKVIKIEAEEYEANKFNAEETNELMDCDTTQNLASNPDEESSTPELSLAYVDTSQMSELEGSDSDWSNESEVNALKLDPKPRNYTEILQRMAKNTMKKLGYLANSVKCHVYTSKGAFCGLVVCPLCNRKIRISCRKKQSFVNSNFKRHLLTHKNGSLAVQSSSQPLEPFENDNELKTKSVPKVDIESIPEQLQKTVASVFEDSTYNSKPIQCYVNNTNGHYSGIFVCPVCGKNVSLAFNGRNFVNSSIRRHMGRHNMYTFEPGFRTVNAYAKQAPDLEDIDIAIQNTLPREFLGNYKLIKRNVTLRNNKFTARLQCPICKEILEVENADNLWLMENFQQHLSNHDASELLNDHFDDEDEDNDSSETDTAQNKKNLEKRLQQCLKTVFGNIIEENTLIEWKILSQDDKVSAKIKCPFPSCYSKVAITYKKKWIGSNLTRHLEAHWQ